jgi:ABC-type phosphate/phosphonate transport system ATPase subunit
VLLTIEKQRTVSREKRRNSFKAALVGYTNAGKSTLLNELSGLRCGGITEHQDAVDPANPEYVLESSLDVGVVMGDQDDISGHTRPPTP